MPEGSGVSLGSAHGSVVITAELDRAAAQITAFDRQVEQQMTRVAQSTKKAEDSFRQIYRGCGPISQCLWSQLWRNRCGANSAHGRCFGR